MRRPLTQPDPRVMGTTNQASKRPMVTSMPSIRSINLQLLQRGLSPSEAANVTAVSLGLRPVESSWSVREMERLRFLRFLVASGRLVA